MKLIKTALYAGLMTGFSIQFVSIILSFIDLRIIFYTIYQRLMLSGIIFATVFLSIALILKIILTSSKIDLQSKTVEFIYSIISLFFILGFYLVIFINSYLFPEISFYDISSILYNSGFFIVLCLFILILLIKCREKITKIIENNKFRSFLKNTLFFLSVFILISFSLDFYQYYFGKTNQDINKYVFKDYSNNDKPNIIFILLDAVRGDHTGFGGYNFNTTPFLDDLAEKSVVFSQAISPTSWTLSSTASLMLGKRLKNTDFFKKININVGETENTLAEILNANGYTTAKFISANIIDYRSGLNQGFDFFLDRQEFFDFSYINKADIRFPINVITDKFKISLFEHIMSFIRSLDSKKIDSSEKLNKQIFPWMEANKKRPFFAFIHYIDAHSPYTFGEMYRKEFANNTNKSFDYKMNDIFEKEKYFTMPEKEITDYAIASYDSEIRFLDKNLKDLIENLEKLNLINKTVLVITADHGEEFFEHGGTKHRTLYYETTHVPFLIYYPKLIKSKIIEQKISTIDSFATILDIANITKPHNLDSNSLLPLIKNNISYENHVISENFYGYGIHSTAIYSDDWKLILINDENKKNKNALFDLKNDPYEQNNLFNTNVEKREELKSVLFNEYPNATISGIKK